MGHAIEVPVGDALITPLSSPAQPRLRGLLRPEQGAIDEGAAACRGVSSRMIVGTARHRRECAGGISGLVSEVCASIRPKPPTPHRGEQVMRRTELIVADRFQVVRDAQVVRSVRGRIDGRLRA